MSAVNEIRRLRYLQAMGVPVYVARRRLPGAAAGRYLRLAEPQQSAALQQSAAALTPAVSDPGSRSASRAPRPAATQRAAAIREALQSAPAPGAAAAPAAVPREPAHTGGGTALRFSLAAMLCADRLWLEELDDALLASDQVKLVAAMARALVHPRPLPAAPSVTQFNWPLHGNQQLDLGPEEAAASLQGFLFRQLEENGCVELICLGAGAASRLRGLKLPCAQRTLPGTREVLADPGRKRELWSALSA